MKKTTYLENFGFISSIGTKVCTFKAKILHIICTFQKKASFDNCSTGKFRFKKHQFVRVNQKFQKFHMSEMKKFWSCRF